MIPTLGRIVHYTSMKLGEGGVGQNAAMITQVDKQDDGNIVFDPEENSRKVSLVVFYGSVTIDVSNVPFSPEYKAGHWSWPPKV